ncbi:peroxisomal carnitine O-octanoyltransferase-like isoform X2 [Tubulanus polymorphus]
MFDPKLYESNPEETFLNYNEKTFQYQDSLPSLPVCSLNQSIQRYLSSVKAVASEAEYANTVKITEDFRNGIGKELQAKLEERGKIERNWLAKWWDDAAYLSSREPVVPVLNIAGPSPMHDHYWHPEEGTQIERAALLVYYATKFWQTLHRENLAVHKKKDGTPLCMNQFRNLYSACKIPREKVDELVFHFKTASEDSKNYPRHFVVQKSGRFFMVDAVDATGELVTPPDLQIQLQNISDICDNEDPGPGLGMLTADYRDKWAENRQHLGSLHPENNRCLRAIDTSLFTVILDDARPATKTEALHQGLLGDGKNRWFDKAVGFVFYKNGGFSTACDHSPFDGIVLSQMTYFVDLCIYHTQGKWQGSTLQKLPITDPHELKFHVDERILKSINEVSKLYNERVSDPEVMVHNFNAFGKNKLKSMKMHPDYFIQVVLQVAYYALYGKPAPTYETATTRAYYLGRTETVRTCTVESVEFAKSMVNNDISVNEKYELLQKAMKTLHRLMTEGQQNKGCDRHLMGLRIIAAEMGMEDHAIFQDPLWQKSGGDARFILSTSLAGYNTVIGGCAPMCRHGYATFYRIAPESLEFIFSSFKSDEDTSCKRWSEALDRGLNDVMTLVQSQQSKL